MRIVLNEKTPETVKRIHLMTTRLCSRNCPNCCNKLYGDDIVPFVTTEELSCCEELYLTGGEPFQFSQPAEIAKWFKTKYPNIKKVIVYSNALELKDYLEKAGRLDNIDGISLSIKDKRDVESFIEIVNLEKYMKPLKYNRVYVFNNLLPESCNTGSYVRINRTWQTLDEYLPAPDSIFRRMI